MRGRIPIVAAGLLAGLVAVAAAPPGEPYVERLVRRLDWRDGLPVSYTTAIEQDREGFLWISTVGGTVRWDGSEIEPVSPVAILAHRSTDAGPIVLYTGGRVWRADGTKLVPLLDDPARSKEFFLAAVATDGAVWLLEPGNSVSRLTEQGLTKVPVAGPAPNSLYGIFPASSPGIVLCDAQAIWRVEPDGSVRRVAAVAHPRGVIERDDRSLVVLANDWIDHVLTSQLLEVREGATRLLHAWPGRALGLTVRGEVIWAATDAGLERIAPGEPAQHIPVGEQLPSGGTLFVDREGSLWVGTYRGLVQFPEPETWVASVGEPQVSRYLLRAPEGTWLTTWGKVLRLDEDRGGPAMVVDLAPFYHPFCRDAAGRFWTANGHGFLQREPNGRMRPAGPPTPLPEFRPCVGGRGGRRWIPLDSGLYLLTEHDAYPRRLALAGGVDAVTEDGAGTLWYANGPRICHLPADAALAAHFAEASCETVEGPAGIADLEPMPSGDIWAVTLYPATVRRRQGGAWTELPGTAKLASRWPISLEPSPSGGVWLLGQGMLLRVVERPDLPDGFEIVETPDPGQGIPTDSAQAVAEDPDGTLWFATNVGLMRLPAAVRRSTPAPPPVVPVEIVVDGHALPGAGPIELPYRRNRLECRFAALSYRHPSALRYRVRLRETDAWSAPTRDSRFRFVGLAPGRYAIEVAASLDGKNWTEPPARLVLHVGKPWYLQAWFFLAAALAMAGGLVLAYRLRVAALLRLERQRTRIAMDLHDEVGSGLGSIGVLAGLVSRPDIAAGQREQFAGRIGATARELSQALGDIVRSLRASSATLDATFAQIVDRARALFPGEGARLEVVAPEPVPPLPLSLVVRRNAFLIAVEALHNAARHAGASQVRLELERVGARWRIVVADDGRGLAPGPEPPPTRRGLGLAAMRARAAEMGGSVVFESAPEAGVRVVVEFGTGRG